jgi:hypothetical protein
VFVRKHEFCCGFGAFPLKNRGFEAGCAARPDCIYPACITCAGRWSHLKTIPFENNTYTHRDRLGPDQQDVTRWIYTYSAMSQSYVGKYQDIQNIFARLTSSGAISRLYFALTQVTVMLSEIMRTGFVRTKSGSPRDRRKDPSWRIKLIFMLANVSANAAG